MVTGPDSVREMLVSEQDAVDELLRVAFGGPEEADLMRALRQSGEVEAEMVLGWQGEVVGYYALSHMVRPEGWLCLAPVAIQPSWQRKGRGRLMMSLLSEWARIQRRYVVVLGQVAFYESGGFSLARAARLNSPYPIENTMLAGPGEDVPVETLQYAQAFGGL